ncbi:hypothetical protein LEP1GSC133_4757 [Leptospira borgpetersenii serovar Pomona str. 200901868]|uniref:Uncharacterized protein n=1 Tax=Leptospira borgpetersenii serovar Pomona str. 200901868 TaxID=1192866 RepID=M6W352_LEPBO|nr:hypothetical protein LEP1GSC133_4757 [Leptospira borgpetersenii serovar Pomona str. 200901868]
MKGKKIKLHPAKPEEIQADRYIKSIRKGMLKETAISRKVFSVK